MDPRSERPLKAGAKGNKAPFGVHFAVWAFLTTIIGIDILVVLLILEMVRDQAPAWVPWLAGFILLLLSVIGTSYVQTLKEGDRNMRNYMSYSVLVFPFGFSWPPSWTWLLFLVPLILIVPLWLPRSQRFFDEAADDSSSPGASRKGPGPNQ